MNMSIEERAENYILDCDNWNAWYGLSNDFFDDKYDVKKAYIQGATEQEKITKQEMIDKAKKAFELAFGDYNIFVKLLEE